MVGQEAKRAGANQFGCGMIASPCWDEPGSANPSPQRAPKSIRIPTLEGGVDGSKDGSERNCQVFLDPTEVDSDLN